MYPRENLRRAMALYAVTDRAWLGERTLSACVEEALAGGATFVQLREKDAPQAEVVLRARALAPLCREAGVPFVVNDDVEAARIAGRPTACTWGRMTPHASRRARSWGPTPSWACRCRRWSRRWSPRPTAQTTWA